MTFYVCISWCPTIWQALGGQESSLFSIQLMEIVLNISRIRWIHLMDWSRQVIRTHCYELSLTVLNRSWWFCWLHVNIVWEQETPQTCLGAEPVELGLCVIVSLDYSGPATKGKVPITLVALKRPSLFMIIII